MNRSYKEIFLNIEKLLIILVDKTYSRTNITSIFTLDTSGTAMINKDITQLLGLPKGYSANEMTIFDKGGGFTYRVNGAGVSITAANNQAFTQEDINRVEFIPAGIAGTAKIKFAAYIPKV